MMKPLVIHSCLITLNCPICVGYKVGYHLELCIAKTSTVSITFYLNNMSTLNMI